MTLTERITSVDKLRSWTDQIPLRYEYTAGVAGEKFLRGLKEGRIIGSRCQKCGKTFVPPKAYCVDCFVGIDRYREVRSQGTASAVAESYVDFDGRRLEKPRTYVFVTFRGTAGGLVQTAHGRRIKAGDRVASKFKTAAKRTGSMSDFEFVKVRG